MKRLMNNWCLPLRKAKGDDAELSMTSIQGTASVVSRDCCDSADFKADTGKRPGSQRNPMRS